MNKKKKNKKKSKVAYKANYDEEIAKQLAEGEKEFEECINRFLEKLQYKDSFAILTPDNFKWYTTYLEVILCKPYKTKTTKTYVMN